MIAVKRFSHAVFAGDVRLSPEKRKIKGQSQFFKIGNADNFFNFCSICLLKDILFWAMQTN